MDLAQAHCEVVSGQDHSGGAIDELGGDVDGGGRCNPTRPRDSGYGTLGEEEEADGEEEEEESDEERTKEDTQRGEQMKALMLTGMDLVEDRDMTGEASVQEDEWLQIDDIFDARDDAEYYCGSRGIIYVPANHPDDSEGIIFSLESMQRQWHAAIAGSDGAAAASATALDWPLRPSCGLGQLTLAPGAVEPPTRNADSHILFRVLLGTVQVTLGDGRARPRVFAASAGDIVVFRPGDFYGLHNASPAAWTVLFYVHSLQREGPAGTAAATKAETAVQVAEETREEVDDADGMPARKKRKGLPPTERRFDGTKQNDG